jgi:hypothetical protein
MKGKKKKEAMQSITGPAIDQQRQSNTTTSLQSLDSTTSINTLPQTPQIPDYNNMYRSGDTTPLQNAFEPMAANDALGSAFGGGSLF